jgi:hypothetical protein
LSKGKKRAFNEWESCVPGLQDGRFMRLSNSQMLHEKMRGLSGNAYKLYGYMKLEAGGALVYEFPRRKFISFMSENSFGRARAELIDAGFIEEEENNANVRKANKYRFSSRWKAPH